MASTTRLPSSMTSLPLLIAHYLSQSGYTSTLSAYLSELPASESLSTPIPQSPIDLRDLVEAYNLEQLKAVSLLEKATDGEDSEEDAVLGVKLEEHLVPKTVERTLGEIHAANILSVLPVKVPRRVFDTSTAEYIVNHHPCLLTTSADKTLKLTAIETGEVEDIHSHHRAAILAVAVHPTQPRIVLTGSMDGTAKVLDLVTREVLQTFNHQKFVVRTAFSPSGTFLATASYDRTIKIYRLSSESSATPAPVEEGDEEADPLHQDVQLRWELAHEETVKSNPEGLTFGPNDAWLAFTTRNDNHLKYIMLPSSSSSSTASSSSSSSSTPPIKPYSIQKYNLNPNGDEHVSFSILHLTLHPSNKFIALLTGDHAGSNNVSRIFLYPFLSAQRRSTLWTGADCDQFSNPRMAWFPSGSAVAVTSDDGFVSIVDLAGKVRARIPAHGQHPTSGVRSEMVRDVAVVEEEDGEEGRKKVRVYSAGFDHTVRVLSV